MVDDNEIIANFTLEDDQEINATFEMQDETINANFSIDAVNGDRTFVFEQAISSTEWIIIHDLNKRPSVTIVDEYDRVETPEIEYKSNSKIIVRFNYAFKGKAYLN